MKRGSIYAKTDKNEAGIVRDLKKMGYSVETGHDDILIGHKGKTFWFEIKNPDEVDKNGKPYARKNKTALKQKKLNDEFKGHYQIVSTLDEILVGLKQE